MPVAMAAVTCIRSGPGAVWVSTKGGHLLAFDPLTADVLLVHQRKCHMTSVVCLSDKRVVTFGEGVVGGGEEEGAVTSGMFTIWETFIT